MNVDEFRLRELDFADAARCAELDALLFPGESPWPEQVFAVEFAHPHTRYWGVEDIERELLVGYAGLAVLGPSEDPEYEIHTIGVDPDYQRRGIGRALMSQIEAAAAAVDGPIFLEVRTDNEPAIAMYEAFGFRILARRKAYYQPSGADAFTMTRASAVAEPGTEEQNKE